jgi:branched-subunit amino acid aminotransferase/4-amino-4-deoxychorismate lyase
MNMAEKQAARIELNGAPASADDLRHLVTTNYGHFSAMRVEEGGVRGLDLHLGRIEAATRELFGTSIERERVRQCLRRAIDGGAGPLALRVNVFSRALNRDLPAAAVEPDLLVTVAPAASAVSAAPRVKSYAYTRTLPHIKHVGTFPLFHFRRLAQQAGFDDAVFIDEAGHVEEGSIWNIGFFDGEGVVWPDAPQLTGVSMQLLQAGLARKGIPSSVRPIPLHDIARFRAAFFTNSSVPVRMISRIDAVEFDVDASIEARLVAAYESNPPQLL